MAQHVRLGDLLIKAGMITQIQLEDVLAHQKRDGRRLGALLVDAGMVTETQVTQILSQQLAVPWVSLYHIDFSRQLLNLVSHELAERHCLIPIFVRRVRGVGDCLYLAMDDPSNDSAQSEVGQAAGLPVRAMIAPPSDIRNAIRVYYGVGEEPEEAPATRASLAGPAPAEQQEQPPATAGSADPAQATDAPRAQAQSDFDLEIESEMVQAAPAGDGPAIIARVALTRPERSSPAHDAPHVAHDDTRAEPASVVPSREPGMPPPSIASKAPRMIALTLLDGTTVRLPAKKTSPPAPEGAKTEATEEQLTARDLVAALRAAAHGADASDILGENARWEAMFAALLSLLLKKHLIADWEFIDAYRKI